MNAVTSLVETFKQELMKLPQVPLDTLHFFADGMYCRVLLLRAGTALVGAVHRKEHFFMVMRGRLVVNSGEGPVVLDAPRILTCQPGTQRAGYALTDVMCLTVHRTDKTDLAEAEADIAEPDPESRYTTGNQLLERTQ